MRPADFKKIVKFGQLPGDKSLSSKIAMYEGRPCAADRRCAKSFKRDYVRRANRAVRRRMKMIARE